MKAPAVDPVVLVTCRDAADEELPTTAARLRKTALAAGWTGRTTYAKADVGEDTEGERKTVESVLVRLRRWPLAAVGAWHNGSFELAYVWSAVSAPRRIGARDLARFIKEMA